MNKAIIYEYDKQNRTYFVNELERQGYGFFCMPSTNVININFDEILNAKNGLFIEISYYFADDEKGIIYSSIIENLINAINEEMPVYFIINRKYISTLQDMLFYKIADIKTLEIEFNLGIVPSKNIVDIEENEFKEVIQTINEDLVGNCKFKKRLYEELMKFRIFNRLGYQPIFSVLICGNSGIGKTEVARIFHKTLCLKEPFIKINFGNYSDQNALSSLIGSPRGYIGSSKGELSDKIANSKAKIILIDEFEKSNKQVQNFFLQLLEDGVFTDSLGREYDLNKYVIIFTANLPEKKVPEKLSPELLSRFNLKYSFSNLNNLEKQEYIKKKIDNILDDIKENLNIVLAEESVREISNIDFGRYENMRDINAEIMKRISNEIYPELFTETM